MLLGGQCIGCRCYCQPLGSHYRLTGGLRLVGQHYTSVRYPLITQSGMLVLLYQPTHDICSVDGSHLTACLCTCQHRGWKSLTRRTLLTPYHQHLAPRACYVAVLLGCHSIDVPLVCQPYVGGLYRPDQHAVILPCKAPCNRWLPV